MKEELNVGSAYLSESRAHSDGLSTFHNVYGVAGRHRAFSLGLS